MKNIANILFGLACMIGIPVSAHFMAGDFPLVFETGTGHLISTDSTLPFPLQESTMRPATYNLYAVADKAVRLDSYRELGAAGVPSVAVVGMSKEGRAVEAYYFPGTSDKVAMVIGGVHGSELSSIEVARTLIETLAGGKQTFYSVLVIPSLFPDNAHAALSKPEKIGSVDNIGRYTASNSVDPNRQMPHLGKAVDLVNAKDYLGRNMERENVMLLELIDFFRPSRIVNIHAIRLTGNAGIYADPRTDAKGIALGFESDSSLAIQMARLVLDGGGTIPGNQLQQQPTALYLKDPHAVPAGTRQPRNFCGMKLPANRGAGVSLGGWASTEVRDPLRPQMNRPAIRLLTMEFPGYNIPAFITDQLSREHCQRNIELYARSIADVFAQENYVEPGSDSQ